MESTPQDVLVPAYTDNAPDVLSAPHLTPTDGEQDQVRQMQHPPG